MRRAIQLVVALTLTQAANAPAAPPPIHAERGGPLAAGRAAFGENTLVALAHAANELRVTLDVDTRLTRDGAVVLMHDATLERTTDCAGLVRERTLAALAACRVDVLGVPGGPGPPARQARRPQPIPTLADALALAKANGRAIDVELNNYATDADYDPTFAAPARVAEAIAASRIRPADVTLESFLPANLDTARQRLPGAKTALLTSAELEQTGPGLAAAGAYDLLGPSWPLTDSDYVSAAHADRRAVVPYGIATAADVAGAVRLGVDGLATLDPLMARRALDRRRPRVALAPRTTRLATVRRTGTLPLRVSLDEPGSVELTARLDGRVVARASIEFTRAKTLIGTLELTAPARRALRRRGGATLRLRARALDLARNARTASAVVRLGR